MDQVLINWLFAFAGALMGWILKVIWDAISDLKRDIKDIEQDLPDSYVRKDDFRDAIGRVEIMLTRIFDKLDAKVDK